MASTIEGDQFFKGSVTMRSVTLPDGCVDDDAIEASAGVDADKLEHQHRRGWSQPNTTATSETRVLHVVHGATGSVVAFEAGSTVANIGAATVTLDLKKNGTSILTSVITLDNANTAYVVEAGAIATASLVDGDVLTVVIVATAGGGTLATGVFCSLTVREDAQ